MIRIWQVLFQVQLKQPALMTFLLDCQQESYQPVKKNDNRENYHTKCYIQHSAACQPPERTPGLKLPGGCLQTGGCLPGNWSSLKAVTCLLGPLASNGDQPK